MVVLIVPILIYILIAFCSREPDCDCGTVVGSREIYLDEIYLLDIRNECTGKIAANIEVTERVYNEFSLGILDIDTQRICNISEKRLN